jgi:hypothetical protein
MDELEKYVLHESESSPVRVLQHHLGIEDD